MSETREVGVDEPGAEVVELNALQEDDLALLPGEDEGEDLLSLGEDAGCFAVIDSDGDGGLFVPVEHGGEMPGLAEAVVVAGADFFAERGVQDGVLIVHGFIL